MAQQSYLNIEDLELGGTKVFLRLDLNVPIKDGQIIDDTRIRAALPTLKYLLEKGAKVIVASHMGRPKTEADHAKLSLEPVADRLNQEGLEVILVDRPDSDAPLELVKQLNEKKIILLENLRFAEGETSNSSELAQKWSRYCDVYINDAFGACHRAHASIDAVARMKTIRCFGFLIKKEIDSLDEIKNSPAEPFVVVTGGSKVSDKIPMLDAFAEKASAVCIGGAMAYTFLKAQGIPVGGSRVEADKINMAKSFLSRMEAKGKKVYLPVDHIVADGVPANESFATDGQGIEKDYMGVDIGPKTRELFISVIKDAKSIFWNGPMGIYETKPFDEGSIAIAKAMAESSGFTVIGGGDSAAAAVDSGFADQISHISTGGGASMEYIQGLSLPGLEVLKVRTVV